MPPKTVPVLKSLTKQDELTLICEWGECQDVFDQFPDFMEHITNHLTEMYQNHVKNNEEGFECVWRECGHDTFPGFPEVLRHINFHAFHVKIKSQGMILILKNNLRGCMLDSASRNMIPELPDRLVCGWVHCHGVFDNPSEFYSHVKNHCDCYPDGNKPSGGCPCLWEGCQTVPKSRHKLKDHIRSHTQEKVVACPTCGGLFSNSTKFFDHIKRQTQSDVHSYQCSHCNKRFSTERLLRDHMRHHVNHYKCPFCDMTCPNPSGLRTHMRYRHTEDRPHSCPQCEYRAKTSIDMRRHLDSHKNDSIHCEFDNCNFKCKTYWDMNNHYRLKHEAGPDSSNSRYICHLCGNKYWRGSKLTDHLRLKHKFKWPSGHTRFRYKVHEDGFFRLQTVRYESIELTEQMLHNRMDEQEQQEQYIVVEPNNSNNEGEITPLSPINSESAQNMAKENEEEAHDPGQDKSTSEADFAYNLEMLGDVALQNSDVCRLSPEIHSAQTSTPIRLPEQHGECGERISAPLSPVREEVMTEFDLARKSMGVFTPIKGKKRKRPTQKAKKTGKTHEKIQPLPMDHAVEHENVDHSNVNTNCDAGYEPVISLPELPQESDTPSTFTDRSVVTSGVHKIAVSSDVPVEFSGVVRVVDDEHMPLQPASKDLTCVIQEVDSRGCVHLVQYANKTVTSPIKKPRMDSGDGSYHQMLNMQIMPPTNEQVDALNAQNVGGTGSLEEDIFQTAKELGISIQNL